MSVTVYVYRDNQELGYCNMANMNFHMVWSYLFTEPEPCGEIKPVDLPSFIERCNQAIALIKADPSLAPGRETVESRGYNGCTIIECGTDDEYVRDRIDSIRRLAEVALTNGLPLGWS